MTSIATKTAVSEQPLSQPTTIDPNKLQQGTDEPTDAEIDNIFELGLVTNDLRTGVNTVLESAAQLREELGIFNHTLKLSTEIGSVIIYVK